MFVYQYTKIAYAMCDLNQNMKQKKQKKKQKKTEKNIAKQTLGNGHTVGGSGRVAAFLEMQMCTRTESLMVYANACKFSFKTGHQESLRRSFLLFQKRRGSLVSSLLDCNYKPDTPESLRKDLSTHTG